MNQKTLKAFFWINALVVFSFWFAITGMRLIPHPQLNDILVGIARLCGLISVNLVLTQFLLIGRIGWIEPSFGHDKLARIHHKVGKYAFYFIILHFCLIIISYSLIGKVNVVEQFLILFNTYPDIPKAFIAFLLFIFIVPISIFIHRLKLKYETWYVIHLMLYVAVLFAYGHQLQVGSDFANRFFVYYWYALYGFVLGNFVLFRLGKPLYNFFTQQFWIEKVTPENAEVTSIYINGKNLDKFPRVGGQFMILRFLDSKRWWQAHPFSLSWGSGNKLLRVSVKNSGDFTSEISGVKVGTRILIDGMHGIFTKKLAKRKKVLFLVGGIGITPIRSMIEDMSKEGGWDMVLLYSNKSSQDIVFQKELKQFSVKVINVISEDTSYKGEAGRIDKEKIQRLVPDVSKRDVYLCGPGAFMDALIAALKEIGLKDDQIHFEKFSLH